MVSDHGPLANACLVVRNWDVVVEELAVGIRKPIATPEYVKAVRELRSE